MDYRVTVPAHGHNRYEVYSPDKRVGIVQKRAGKYAARYLGMGDSMLIGNYATHMEAAEALAVKHAWETMWIALDAVESTS